jgi:hypothetical protein
MDLTGGRRTDLPFANVASDSFRRPGALVAEAAAGLLGHAFPPME